MSVSLSKIFTIFSVVSIWAETALADGKVTLIEAVALVTELASILGISTELEIPTLTAEPLPETDETEHATGRDVDPGNERPPPR